MKFLKHFPVLASLNLSSDQPPDIEEKHVAVVLARDLEELWESGDVFPVRADGIFELVVPNGITCSPPTSSSITPQFLIFLSVADQKG
ncbi:hypothetical protein DY000_02008367 [Brassica cretica]|uniref:Uncharacterized protein n=1 Tax=Brassica cretica TaxID=69181 RepID=A0ABQ7BYE8_BRACR|nr:hypothetical protein DY000_02008367 [Brassica cretica]